MGNGRGKERSGEGGGRRRERRDGEEGERFEVRVGSHRVTLLREISVL